MVWMNQQDKKQSVIRSVKPNLKQTGWIIQCEDFDCFMWNSDKLLSFLLVALEKYCEEMGTVKLVVVADTTQKRGFKIELVELKKNEELNHWIKVGNLYKIAEPEDFEGEINPFL